jgi:hypothetical protein
VEITFHSVTITIEAKSPREAYAQLCSALGKLESEWETRMYSTDDGQAGPTTDLFPPELTDAEKMTLQTIRAGVPLKADLRTLVAVESLSKTGLVTTERNASGMPVRWIETETGKAIVL